MLTTLAKLDAIASNPSYLSWLKEHSSTILVNSQFETTVTLLNQTTTKVICYSCRSVEDLDLWCSKRGA